MPQYRLDKKDGSLLVLDERSIGEDGRFPDTYPPRLPDGSDNELAGQPHPKAGEINWDYLMKECGFKKTIRILPFDEKQNLDLNAAAPGLTVSKSDVDAIRREVYAEMEAKFAAMLDARLAALGIRGTVKRRTKAEITAAMAGVPAPAPTAGPVRPPSTGARAARERHRAAAGV